MTVLVDDAKYHTVHEGDDYWFLRLRLPTSFHRRPERVPSHCLTPGPRIGPLAPCPQTFKAGPTRAIPATPARNQALTVCSMASAAHSDDGVAGVCRDGLLKVPVPAQNRHTAVQLDRTRRVKHR